MDHGGGEVNDDEVGMEWKGVLYQVYTTVPGICF